MNPTLLSIELEPIPAYAKYLNKIYIHVVLAVKYRKALIGEHFAQNLYRYMASIIKSEGQIPIIINGMPDHVHLVFIMKPIMSVSDLMRVVKANSSRWLNAQHLMSERFLWQRGFGAFSIGEPELDILIRYVKNQQIHHGKKSFKEEYCHLLETFKVDFDSDYLFEWI